MAELINYMNTFTASTSKTLTELLKMIEEILKERSDSQSSKELLAHIEEKGANGCNFTICNDILSKEFSTELERRGVPYNRMIDTNTGHIVYLTRDTDLPLVQESKETLYLKHKQVAEVSFDTLAKNNLSPMTGQFNPLAKMEGLTKNELALMRTSAAKYNLVFAKKETEKGYDLYCSQKDMEKMQNLYLKARVTLTSELGDCVNKQLENSRKQSEYIMNKISKECSEKDFVVFSKENPGNRVEVGNGYTRHCIDREGEPPFIKRDLVNSRKDDIIKCSYLDINSMSNPIIIPKKDFEEIMLLEKDKRKRKIYEYEKELKKEIGSVSISKEDFSLAEKERMGRELIESFLGQDNADLEKNIFDLYEGNLTFSRFYDLNKKNLDEVDIKLDNAERAENIANMLDELGEKEQSHVREYIKKTQEVIEEYQTRPNVTIYVPTENDLEHNIDQFIEDMTITQNISIEREEIETTR